MAAKHFKICYQSGTGSSVVKEPRSWARENQVYSPLCDFINKHTNFKAIEGFFIKHRNFQRVDNTSYFVLVQNVE